MTKEYYRDMAKDDPKEFVCLAGEERIVEMFANGQTLEDWLKEHAEVVT